MSLAHTGIRNIFHFEMYVQGLEGGGDPVFPLLLANPSSREQSNLESRIFFSEIPDPMNTLPDPVRILLIYRKTPVLKIVI